MLLKNHFALLLSRTFVTNQQILSCPIKFVKNFLVALLVVSVCLLDVKRAYHVPKRKVYFREKIVKIKFDGIQGRIRKYRLRSNLIFILYSQRPLQHTIKFSEFSPSFKTFSAE